MRGYDRDSRCRGLPVGGEGDSSQPLHVASVTTFPTEPVGRAVPRRSRVPGTPRSIPLGVPWAMGVFPSCFWSSLFFLPSGHTTFPSLSSPLFAPPLAPLPLSLLLSFFLFSSRSSPLFALSLTPLPSFLLLLFSPPLAPLPSRSPPARTNQCPLRGNSPKPLFPPPPAAALFLPRSPLLIRIIPSGLLISAPYCLFHVDRRPSATRVCPIDDVMA